MVNSYEARSVCLCECLSQGRVAVGGRLTYWRWLLWYLITARASPESVSTPGILKLFRFRQAAHVLIPLRKGGEEWKSAPFIFYDTLVNTFIPLEKLNLHILCLWPFAPKCITLQNARPLTLRTSCFCKRCEKVYCVLPFFIWQIWFSPARTLGAKVVRSAREQFALPLLIKWQIEFWAQRCLQLLMDKRHYCVTASVNFCELCYWHFSFPCSHPNKALGGRRWLNSTKNI